MNRTANIDDSYVLCRLCKSQANYIFNKEILGKYNVRYYRCSQCDLMQTESPYWLEEAYSEVISSYDTGVLVRCEVNRNKVVGLSKSLNLGGQTCMDYGGGHGIFVRMMRDKGLDFHWYDKYARNIYCKTYEADLSSKYHLVTSFEVLEHLVDVEEELIRIFGIKSDYILVSTGLYDGKGFDWWYYLPKTGQHVAFYSAKTIDYIADKFELNVITGTENDVLRAEYVLFYRKNIIFDKKTLMSINESLGINNSVEPSLGESPMPAYKVPPRELVESWACMFNAKLIIKKIFAALVYQVSRIPNNMDRK